MFDGQVWIPCWTGLVVAQTQASSRASSAPSAEGFKCCWEGCLHISVQREMLKTFEVFLWKKKKKISFKLNKWIGGVFLSLFISLIFNVQAQGTCVGCRREIPSAVVVVGVLRAQWTCWDKELSSLTAAKTFLPWFSDSSARWGCRGHVLKIQMPRPHPDLLSENFWGDWESAFQHPPSKIYLMLVVLQQHFEKHSLPSPNPAPFLHPLRKILDSESHWVHCWN